MTGSTVRERLVEWGIAAVVAAVLVFGLGLSMPAATAPDPGHGWRFVRQVAAPFAFDGEIPHRVLWPLLANVASHVGIGPVAFSHVCNGLLLAVVFWFCRQRAAARLDALLVTAAVAASGAVRVYHQPMACLSDSLNFTLLVLTVHFVARPFVFWGLVLLAGLSHEMVFFLWPWLVWLRVRDGGGSLGREGLWLAATLAAYAGWRMFVGALAPPAAAGGPTYDAWYYILNNFWVPWLLPGLWALWAMVVLAEFGPLLVLAAVGWRRGEHGLGGRIGPWLYLGCILLMMVLAYDVMRFASFVFLPVVFGALALLRLPTGRLWVAGLVLASLVTYAWEHPVPSQQGGATFTRVAGEMFGMAAPIVAAKGVMGFADAMRVQGEAFARQAVTWGCVVLGLCAAAALGGWLARRPGYVGSASSAGSEPRTQRNASP